jgi:hypothetical protein
MEAAKSWMAHLAAWSMLPLRFLEPRFLPMALDVGFGERIESFSVTLCWRGCHG